MGKITENEFKKMLSQVNGDGHLLAEDLTVDGDLNLYGTYITSLPEGLKVDGSLYLCGTDITYLPEGLKVDGDLYLYGSGITSLPAGLMVGGSLDLEGTGVTALPEDLMVGGSLYLKNTGITSLPEGLKVNGDLYLYGTGITSLPAGLMVGGSLYLYGTGITSLPAGLMVGGSLHLKNTGITSLPEDLTVGGNLYLEETGITALPENLTVGGNLYLRGTKITSFPKRISLGGKVRGNVSVPVPVTRLKDGDYVDKKYLYADGILTHVKKRKSFGEYTVYIGKIPGHNVVSDGKYYAHCGSIRDGIADLLFKSAKDRGAKQYQGLSLDTELTVPQMVTMYRVITGACRQGSENFVRGLGPLREKYSIREAIELTRGQYNAEAFADFF